MILRNKKTGKIIIPSDYTFATYDDGIRFNHHMYYSLAELNEEWEDYKPKESRINFEDARDAVRSWASALQIHEVTCKKTMRGFGIEAVTFEAHRLGSAPRIEFTSSTLDADVTDGAIYTIDELCGEEEK